MKRRNVQYQCGPYTWTEEWVTDNAFLAKYGADGVCDFSTNRVLMSSAIEDPTEERISLLHERLHVCLASMLATGELSAKLEERVCYAVSRGLVQIQDTTRSLRKRSRK